MVLVSYPSSTFTLCDEKNSSMHKVVVIWCNLCITIVLFLSFLKNDVIIMSFLISGQVCDVTAALLSRGGGVRERNLPGAVPK